MANSKSHTANRQSAKMTPGQKRIVAVLAVANIVVILALVVLMTYRLGTGHSPLPKPTPALSQQTCLWRATQRLAQAGLSGTVTLTPDSALRFAITYSLAPGQTADEAAQSVWTAFDIALTLLEEECATFSRVEATVMVHNGVAETTINASVSTTDLVAFGAKTLNEDEFIERVTYAAGKQ